MITVLSLAAGRRTAHRCWPSGRGSSWRARSRGPGLRRWPPACLVAAWRSLQASHPDLVKTILTEANYFQRNQERMRYPKFRQQGLFVGSGVIEAGCKTVIGRLKQSGMFWTVRGANAIIALRCCQLSGKFEDYWEARRA